MWNFPNYLGAIDGKHIIIQACAKSGSHFCNYKDSFSIILLAACNDDYEFMLIDIGEAGRHSDRGVFSNRNFSYTIIDYFLGFSEPENFNGIDFILPLVFVGYDTFRMTTNLVKPYSALHLHLKKLITNS